MTASSTTQRDAPPPLPVVSRERARAAEPDHRLKPPVDSATLVHKQLLGGEFWRRIPAYRNVDEAMFLDYRWQMKNSVTKVAKLLATVQHLVADAFIDDVREGFHHAPMAVRVTPYVISLIDWTDPYADPIRRQFVPTHSELLPDHPKLELDSLHELADSPVRGLTHRYPDKALFLALDTCPVYCRFCTRSYAVGLDTDEVEKLSLKANLERWESVFRYIASRPELEDIVISGGDSYNLRSDQVRTIGERLLAMKSIRRIRFATKGPAVMPQKVLTDHSWIEALSEIAGQGRKQHKEVCIHTHFNHPSEITGITERAMNRLFERGITLRNQSVLLRGVNDDAATMGLLIKRLGHLNVHPYYVYMHDLVKGVENLRTTLQTALDIEKETRGMTAGFNTPTFVTDAPGGGGKRDVCSYDWYEQETGVSVYRSPTVDPDAFYCYFDPIDLLPESGRRRWADPGQRDAIVGEAIESAKHRLGALDTESRRGV